MELIREYVSGDVSTWCVIRTDTYAHSFAYIQSLALVAKKDFPDLEDTEIGIKVYDNNRYKRTMGIEFKLPDGATIPESYHKIAQLSPTF